MGDNRKPLRRKPPPPMDEPPHNPYNAPIANPFNQRSPQAQFPSRNQPQLHINPEISQRNPEDSSDADITDMLLSFDSPRPKGPQELLYDDFVTSESYPESSERDRFGHPSNAYSGYHSAYPEEPPIPQRPYSEAQRPYSEGLDRIQSGYAPSMTSPPLPPKQPPIPPRPTGFDRSSAKIPDPLRTPTHSTHSHTPRQSPLVNLTPPVDKRQFQMSDSEDETFNHTNSTGSSNPPYPLEEPSFSENEDSQYQTPKKSTPVRIPTLVNQRSMRNMGGSFTVSANGSPNFNALNIETGKASPESLSPQFPHSPFSSPSKSSFLRRSPNTYSDYVSESRSSRSPSPKKYHGSPPTVKPPYPEDDLYDLYDEYSYEERAPRWSLIEHHDAEYFDDSFGITPTNEFDYSILPEIPKAHEESVDTTRILPDFDSSPTIRPTLTLKRKNEDLPPVPLDLPSLPFSSSSLSGQHFVECANVWALSEIYAWCLKLNSWVHDAQITQKDLRKVLMKLVTFHKSDVPLDIIGRNVTQILDCFTSSGVITRQESENPKNPLIVINAKADVSGVLVDLAGCYCKDDDHKGKAPVTLKCYSSHCSINKALEQENVMKTTDIHDIVLGNDWASHWKLSAQDMTIDLSESKRQSLLFDLMKFEQTFIQRVECFIAIAFPEFIRSAKLIEGSMGILQIKDLEKKMTSSAKDLVTIHRASLFEPLLKVFVEDGKFIKNLTQIASLYYSWSKAALNPLLAYMASMPSVEELLRTPALKQWDETLRSNPRMKELQVNGNLLMISTINSRYQQLPLQLMDIRKFFDEDDEEYNALTRAISSIQKLGSKVNEMKVHSDNKHSLQLVEKQVTWKSNIFQPNLNLLSERRKLLYRGDLFKKGDLKINSSSVHLILLDNYLLITDRQRSQKSSIFKVFETPIPIDYLIVEYRDKETSLTPKSAATQTSLMAAAEGEDASSFPFKVRYAGRGKHNSHTFIASSEKDRKKWISSLLHAKSIVSRRVSSSSPYKLELLDNSFFGYEPGFKSRKLPLLPPNDPLMKIASEPPSIPTVTAIQQQVFCSESFEVVDTTFQFVGTSAGVYCTDCRNIWKKVINMSNVTKLSIIPELNTILVLGSKTLRYYPLQSVIDIYYEKKEKLSSFQLSNEAILFYEYGRHRGVPTVFVAKKKNAGSTTFKVFVMEQDNNGIMSQFSVTARFYIQAECFGLSIFNSSVAVHTQRGFEILDLQKLSPRTVPELPQWDAAGKKYDSFTRKKAGHHFDLIKKAISHTTPMGMFKLSNNKEFLLVYSECAVFVNKTGKLSRTSLMRFDFRPRKVSFARDNLFLVSEEVVEVWAIGGSSSHSKLIQVIPCKDINVINAETLTFKSANPTTPDLQLLFSLQSRES